MTRAAALCALVLALTPPARAAGPADGRATASAEASLRAEGAELVEIEGFTGPDGDIPCKGNSFANAWHYKFYVPASGEWLIVNACGDNFINAAKNIPYMKSEEPDKKLPYSFAAPAAVLKKLEADGAFRAEPNPFSRDVRMLLRMMPAKDGRPAGCYWTVSQGKAKAMADCPAEKTWKIGKGAPAAAAAGGAPGTFVKGKDTAGRYAALALQVVRKKLPDAQLMAVETLADKTGSTKCVDQKDGWSFFFVSRSMGSTSTFGGCKNKTTVDYMGFDGVGPQDLAKLAPLSMPFKDSDLAISRVPGSCAAATPTISMKLKNFKPGHAPVTGHSMVWVIDCGSQHYYVDAQTGLYLGPAAK